MAVPNHRLPHERRGRGRHEAGDAVDPERPAPTRWRRQVEHVRIVRHEEGGEADALKPAHEREQRNRRSRRRQERRGSHEARARQHEAPPSKRVDQGTNDRLAQDADRVVETHHEADLDLRPSDAFDVERQENEAVQAEEEKEVRDRRPNESLVG